MKIVISGGGTGGHLYPALATAEALEGEAEALWFIGSERGLERRILPQTSWPYFLLPSAPLRGKTFGGRARGMFSLQRGILSTMRLLRELRPDLVICTGGYASAATGFASVLLRIPTLLEEQNALPGRVNRLLSHLSAVTCVGFRESLRFLPTGRCRVTGIPLRRASMEGSSARAFSLYPLPKGRPMILVLGGSQGSQSINRAVLSSASAWIRQGYGILHSTGLQHYEEVAKEVQKLGLQDFYFPLPFLDPIGDAYAVASLVLCRAGAGTLAEVAYWGLPSLLIPYPYAADQHQWFNALVMQKEGASLLLRDSELKTGVLTDLVITLLEDSSLRNRMRASALALAHPEAKEMIAGLARDIIQGEKGKKENGRRNLKLTPAKGQVMVSQGVTS